MKNIYIIAMLILFWSCSKERIHKCGLIGVWVCCNPVDECITSWQGQSFTTTWSFEDDGDLFSSGLTTSSNKWNTEDDCSELVFDPNTPDEHKVKIDINGDELVLHYGSIVGDLTFCRQ